MKFGLDFRRLAPIESPVSTTLSIYWLSMSSFANGAPPDYLYAAVNPYTIHQLYHNFSMFAQDTWKASHRLTLTYGVRWDYNPPPTETNGHAPYAISEITNLATATLPRALRSGTPIGRVLLRASVLVTS
jgi:outer membrane receptor protein involved in Fe transport